MIYSGSCGADRISSLLIGKLQKVRDILEKRMTTIIAESVTKFTAHALTQALIQAIF